MIRGIDSAYPPSQLSIVAARGAGVRLWAGYFSGPNILNGWALEDFQRVQTAGLSTLAFCSGWADPLAMRAQSLTWDVPICLDVEGQIRPDGAWKQPWLDAANSGLYGNLGVHSSRAAFHVVSDYVTSDPNATWIPGPRPLTPCGWQWQGSHPAFGMTVDSAWYDDAFGGLHGGGGGSIQEEDDMPKFVIGPTPPGEIWAIGDSVRHIGPEEWANVWLKLTPPPSPVPVDAATLAEIKASAPGTFPGSVSFSGTGTLKP